MSKASPAFQFYPSDFLSSTITFTDAEVGVYMRLLAWSWLNGPLPLDSQRVRRAAVSSASDTEWASIWGTIEPRWDKQAQGYVNPRLERIRAEQEDYRERQKRNGLLGGRPKTHSKPKTNPLVNPNVTQPLTHSVTQTEPKNNPSAFDLCSSPLISDLQSSPLPSDSQERVTPSKPAFRYPPSKRSPSLLGGVHPNCHAGTWGACHRGMCIPPFLVAQWKLQLGEGADVTDQLRTFVDSTLALYPEGTPFGDDPLKFWRGKWSERHGTKLQGDSKGARIVSEAQRAVQLVEARQAREAKS